MSSPIEGLEPAALWRYFAEISKIPRGSENEEKVGRYVADEAGRLGLEVIRDAAGNVLVRKDATRGYEGKKPICLQSHLDMVCEKNKSVTHDFEKDPIKIRREGDWLYATGTTLGADNGMGVALSLAMLAETTVEHGPIECLFTVNEENGMTGVKALKPEMLRSRILLNLDSEDDGVFFIGCAGGVDTVLSLKVTEEVPPKGHKPRLMEVTGLKGGHSGLDINEGRASAIQLLPRILTALAGKATFRLASLKAGNKRNAIAREGEAVLLVADSDMASLEKAIEEVQEELRQEFRLRDPGVEINLKPAAGGSGAKVMAVADQLRVLATLQALPHGVCAMSKAVPGLVETSTNLGVLDTRDGVVTVISLTRSSVDSAKQNVVETIRAVGRLAGAEMEIQGGYAGWNPNPESPLLKAAQKVFSRLAGQEPKVAAIHAGLECAIIGGLYEGMDMLSYGPTLQCVHSPDERVQISTVPRFWKLTCELLKSVG